MMMRSGPASSEMPVVDCASAGVEALSSKPNVATRMVLRCDVETVLQHAFIAVSTSKATLAD
jgi:hypothetical protein